MTDDSIYRWADLDENSFRVIRILTIEPEITIRLEHYAFDRPPEYHAISYAWGSEQPSESIYCDRKILRVTKHLYEGLKCINHVTKHDLLWADAISIDQDNDQEKEHQVRNMHRIFRNALSVLIWLGPEEQGSNIAMTAINDVKDRLPIMPEDLSEALLQMKTHEYYKIFELCHFKPLAALSRRSWFRRLWVAQEFIVGHSISFVCGLQVVDGASFVKVIRRLTTMSFGGQQPDTTDIDGYPFEGFRMLSNIGDIKKSVAANEAPNFFDLVMFGRDRETYEPLDHLYAVLGLAEGRDEIYRGKISVNYSKENRIEYWNTYSEFGKVALLHEDHLRLLNVTSSHERPTALPSWCPNLHTPALTSTFTEVFASGWPGPEPHHDPCSVDGSMLLPCASAHPRFKSKTANHVQLFESSNTISIIGGRLDRVRDIVPSFSWGPDFNTDDLYTAQPFAEELLKWLEAGEKFCINVAGNNELGMFIFEEVLVSATDPKHERRLASDAAKENSPVYTFLKQVASQILALKPDPPGRAQNPNLYEMFEKVLAWIVVMQDDWTNRVMFATERGRLGKATEGVAAGDSVCMFYSGHSMYILRGPEPTSGTCSFISDAYVYGFMNGEIFDLMHTGEVKEEVFLIE